MKTINIKGDVVDNETGSFYDFFGIDSACPKKVEDALNDADEDAGEDDETEDSITVNVASPGGDVFAASEIYSMLKGCKKKVNVKIQGLAASAASVIAMAGDTVSISPTAQIMIHKASSGAEGNADAMAHEANVLSSIDESIANAYVAKTGLAQGDVLQMMSNETWLTAQDAVDKGFADEIMFVSDKKPVAVNAASSIIPKSAVNKLFNLINKVENKQPKAEIKNEESKEDSQLVSDKLAILFGK